MSLRRFELECAAYESLAACAARPGSAAAGRWLLSRPDGSAAACEARFADSWLELTVPLSGCAAHAVARGPAEHADVLSEAALFLARNAQLRGGVKFALARIGDAAPYQLRADIPLDGAPAAVSRRITEAWHGFEDALAPRVDAAGPDAGAGTPIDLRALLGASEWPFRERADGSLSVDLTVPEAFFQAEIGARGSAACCAVELPVVENADDRCREALALLLLRAAAVVRMARPVIVAGAAPRFEVVFGSEPSAAEVGHALSALAVACRLFGREVDVIQRSPAVAARVLALLEGAAPSAPSSFRHDRGADGTAPSKDNPGAAAVGGAPQP